MSSFFHARNICVRHKFWVLDTKNVSENVQKHFLCPRGAQQCCLVLPRTGNIAGHNVAATMCPRFARALDWPYRDDFVRVISFGGFEIYDGKYVCTTEPQFLSLELSLVSSSMEQLRGKHECTALERDLPISCFQFHSKSSSTFEWVDQLYNLHAWPGFDADRQQSALGQESITAPKVQRWIPPSIWSRSGGRNAPRDQREKSGRSWRKRKKRLNLPSLFMLTWKHLRSLHAWHWFRRLTSTGHRLSSLQW